MIDSLYANIVEDKAMDIGKIIHEYNYDLNKLAEDLDRIILDDSKFEVISEKQIYIANLKRLVSQMYVVKLTKKKPKTSVDAKTSSKKKTSKIKTEKLFNPSTLDRILKLTPAT